MATKTPRLVSLKGIFPAITTPFEAKSHSVDYEKLKFNLDKYKNVPFAGYLVCGSFGEAPLLRPDERVEIVRHVRENIDSSRLIMGNATQESTKETYELCKRFAAAGADLALVQLPSYYKAKTNNAMIENHFTKVADESPIPLVIYNSISVTTIDIPISIIVKLAQHPNVRGVKESDVRKMAAIVKATKGKKEIKGEFDVMADCAGNLLYAMQAGCSGSTNGSSVALGSLVCELYELCCQRKWDQAIELELKLTNLDLEFSRLGAPGLKACLDILGYYGGPCREPLLPVTQTDIQRIKAILEEDKLV